jgi:hypothetical protein
MRKKMVINRIAFRRERSIYITKHLGIWDKVIKEIVYKMGSNFVGRKNDFVSVWWFVYQFIYNN